VFALHIPELASLGPARVADVVLRYVAVGDDVEAHELTIPVMVNLVSADEAATAEIDHEVTEEVWLLTAVRARKEAIEAADRGDVGGSRGFLFEAAETLRARSPTAARSEELLAEAEALETHAASVESSDPMWRKRVRSEQWRRNRGRPTR
jgi:hypothetical protein